MFENDAYKAPLRKYRQLPGRIPTLGEIAMEDAWVWAYCSLPCGHSAAIPIAPVISRLGTQASSDKLRAALTCTVCGRRGATIRKPSWSIHTHTYGNLPLDRAPAWAKRYLASSALSAIGVVLS